MTSLPVEDKPDLQHGEHLTQVLTSDDVVSQKRQAVNDGLAVPLKSSFDNLSLLETVKVFRKTALICLLAAFVAGTDGYQNQMVSSIVANAGFKRQFGDYNETKKAYVLDPLAVSTFGGLFSCGQVLGQFSTQWLSDWIGRKKAMYATMLVLIVAVTLEVTAKVWPVFTVAKLLGGIGIGAVQATLPVYIAEHAPNQIRGFLIVAYSFWFSLGGLMASITLQVRNVAEPMNWQTPLYIQYGMIGVSFLIFVLLPESPWWLVGKGKTAEARKVLVYKYGGVEGYDIDGELAIIAGTIELQRKWDREAAAEGPFAILQGLNLKRFLIGSWPKVLQQFVGLSVFSNYSAYFFQLAGNKNPFLVTIILGCVSLVAVVVDASLVDKIGRRRMTLFGFTGACSGITLMAIIGCFDYANAQLGSVLVFAGALANFCNTFQSSTSYAYLTEMPEQRFRARATGWGLAWCNCWAILFSFTVPLMIKVWVVKTAFLFVGLGIPGTVLAYFIMPESAQRSSAEIHEMFTDRVPLRRWKGYKTAVERELEDRVESYGNA